MKATLNMHGLAGCGTVLIWWSYVLSSSVCIWRAVCVSKACMGRKSDKAILELSVRGHQIWILMSGLLINWVDRRVYFRAKSKLSISLFFFKKSLNFFFVNGRRTHCYSQIQSTTHNSLHILIQFIGNGKFKGGGWINVPVLLIGNRRRNLSGATFWSFWQQQQKYFSLTLFQPKFFRTMYLLLLRQATATFYLECKNH